MKGRMITPKRNPNKRPCIARHITFRVQEENDYWLMKLKKKSSLLKWF